MSNKNEIEKENKYNFEDKIQKAKQLLEILTDPEITLQNSMKTYKDGIKELKDAQNILDEAKLDFQELSTQNE